MTQAKQIIKVSLEQIGLVAPLFDGYRQFYGQSPNLEGAHQFLFERVQRGQSVIYAVVDQGNALGFTQLYSALPIVFVSEHEADMDT